MKNSIERQILNKIVSEKFGEKGNGASAVSGDRVFDLASLEVSRGAEIKAKSQ